MKELKNYSLLAHNTFGIDAGCDRFVVFSDVADAIAISARLTEPYMILGGGSNLLLTEDFHGTVVKPETRFDVEVVRTDCPHVRLKCWAGTVFDELIAYAVARQYHGLESLSLIPGEVGASAVQNIGAYGVEVKELIESVEAVEIATGRVVTFSNADCAYSYRQSKFKHEWANRYLITYVTFRLSTVFKPHLDYGNIRAVLARQHITVPTAEQLRQTVIAVRKEKLPDPAEQGNAGSFFMNPIVDKTQYERLAAQYPDMPHYTVDATHEKIPAGWMIDQCGWKGRSLGAAGVHRKQALVLVNLGGATGKDIVNLCNTIQKDVLDKFGIVLHPEVNIR